jgi:hypothetical protein
MEKTIIYKTLHRKLQIENQEPHKKTRVIIGSPGRSAVSALRRHPSCYFVKDPVISRDAIANYKIVIEPDNTGWAMFTT